jgi:hypothetical protein
MNDTDDDAEVFGIADCIISRSNNEVQIANFSPNSVFIDKGNILGYMHNPNSDLNTEKDLSKEELVGGKAKINLIQSILAKTPIIPPSEEEVEFSMPVEGAPKTSETPPEVIPSERLLSELHFSESLTSEQHKCLEEIALKHSNALGLDGHLGHYPAEVEINLHPGTKEISLAPYSVSPAKREVIDKQVDEWLKLEVIEPSKSGWGFPVLIVWRNNKPRLCIDYRKLNEVAVPDEFPLPKQTDILHALEGSQYLTTLDALAGFTQLKIKESD